MSRNIVETVLGAIVIIVALGFLVWAYARSDAGGGDGYELAASFDQLGGLEVGDEVRISGIEVGSVVSQSLDPQTYRATVRFSVREGIELPADSSVAINSTSLLGGKYLSIVPGAEDVLLADGDKVSFTQSAINLEDLVGQFIFGSAGGEGGGAAAATPDE